MKSKPVKVGVARCWNCWPRGCSCGFLDTIEVVDRRGDFVVDICAKWAKRLKLKPGCTLYVVVETPAKKARTK